MAGKFREQSGSRLKSRIWHEWLCEKHCEPIKFFCESHELTICYACAIVDHRLCHVNDIKDVIKRLEKELEEKLEEIEEAKIRLTELDVQIKSCNEFAKKHAESLKDEVKAACKNEIEKGIEKARKEAERINEEADKKIRLINEQRKEQLKKCHENKEQQQKPINLYQEILLQDIKDIDNKVQEKIDKLQKDCENTVMKIKDSEKKIKKLFRNREDMVNCATQVIAKLAETLEMNENEDTVRKVRRAVQSVRCSTGTKNGEFYGRIDGYTGEWKIVDTIRIPINVRSPFVAGWVGEDEIVISENALNGSLFLTNISNKNTDKAAQGSDPTYIETCVRVNSDMIACSKRGCIITVNDREWKLIRNITVPRNTTYINTLMNVDVDRDGMILVAELDQSTVYVINPVDGRIANIITLRDNKVLGRIQALSSGDIVVQTGNNTFSVISRSGVVKASIHNDKWVGAVCSVDLTDTLYISYWDHERGVFAVDQASCDGVFPARRIIEYNRLDPTKWLSPSVVTPSGKLIAFRGNEVLIYKKVWTCNTAY